MIPGYYSVKFNGEVIPARWDGEKFIHVHGHGCDEVICDEQGTPVPLNLTCPTGCTCTTNSDGSITVSCKN